MRLPDFWGAVRLTEVCELNPRLLAEDRPDDDAEVTFVPMSAVDEASGVISKPELRKFGEVAKGYTSFREHDVLFAKVTPCMENGKAAVTGPLSNGLGFGSTEFHVLRPTEAVLPEYVFHFIRQQAFRDRAASAFIGTGGLQRVPPEFLSRVKLPLPTLPEQQRIVDVLKELNQLLEYQRKLLENWGDFQTTLFLSLFGNPGENPNSYRISSLGDLVDCFSGGTPSREVVTYWNGSIPWVSPKDMKSQIISSAEECISELALANSATRMIPAESVLVVTRSGILQSQLPIGITSCPVAINQDIKALVPKDGINGTFLACQLATLTPFILAQVRQGATVHNLETNRLLKTKLIVPPISVQEEFANNFQQGYEIYRAALAKGKVLVDLKSQITAMAFAGELTSSWRENHANVIAEFAKARDALLRERGAKLSKATEPKPISAPSTEAERPARHWLLGELSEFQRQVLAAFSEYSEKTEQPLLAEDPDVFARFCDDEQVGERLQLFGSNLNNRIRRTLSQLAALGLIAKVTLPKHDLDSGEREYLKAFRPLREAEFVRHSDLATLLKAFTSDEPWYSFTVVPDFETSEHAGAGGMFQVADLRDENDQSRIDLVEQGKHYATLDELADDIARRLGVPVSQIVVEE